MPYDKVIALPESAKSRPDMNVASTEVNPSEMVDTQKQLVFCVVVMVCIGSLAA